MIKIMMTLLLIFKLCYTRGSSTLQRVSAPRQGWLLLGSVKITSKWKFSNSACHFFKKIARNTKYQPLNQGLCGRAGVLGAECPLPRALLRVHAPARVLAPARGRPWRQRWSSMFTWPWTDVYKYHYLSLFEILFGSIKQQAQLVLWLQKRL